MKQHISSYDHFISHSLKQIVTSPSCVEIRSDNDPNFFLRYTDCWVGNPDVEAQNIPESHIHKATPFRCRMRDLTYSAPIWANITYIRGKQKVNKKVSEEAREMGWGAVLQTFLH
jgi:DNA-directed RNA polymerase III subunit RPC2|tara:strand:+ start:259 stop:603 length:345 start_codon:yes stop_codon:yes gene_type:complete